MSNAVQPMASAVNLTTPAPTFMNKVRAGNRPTLIKIGAVIATLVTVILIIRRFKGEKYRSLSARKRMAAMKEMEAMKKKKQLPADLKVINTQVSQLGRGLMR